MAGPEASYSPLHAVHMFDIVQEIAELGAPLATNYYNQIIHGKANARELQAC